MSREMTKGIDYISRDYRAFKAVMLEKLQEKMPEYTDISETDAGVVIIEALANGLDIMSMYLDSVANDVILPTTQDRSIAVILANNLGYSPYNQTTSVYSQVFVLSEERDVDTVIPRGTIVKTSDESDIETLYFETMEDLVIPSGKLGDEKDDDGNYLYHTSVYAGETINEDIIGTSSGVPLQSFACSYAEVLVDSLQVFVDEGEGEVLWTRVDSFFDADENSKVYKVTVDDFDVCYIEFGNGIKGKIPVAYPNGISASYRIGGGEATNVNNNIITEMETEVPYVESTFNFACTTLAHDKEGLDSIKNNAPAMFRTRDRMVTLTDYEDLLRINFYPFLSLKAIRDDMDRKLVHLYYMLREGYTYSQELAENVASFISERAMIGTTYDLNPYTPQVVNITATLYANKDYDSTELVNQIKDYLSGVTFKYDNLLFEDSIVKSDLESELKSVFEGILSLRITSPTTDIISPTTPDRVLTLGSVNISVQQI